jgi:hypothetical protein
MLMNTQVTVRTLGSAVEDESLADDPLNLVAIRLLTVALRGLRGKARRLDQARLAIPRGYHLWPMVEAEAGTGRSRQAFKLFVCPKGVSTAYDERFPVETVFVVETLVFENRARGPLTSIFVMQKLASMDVHGRNSARQDVWIYGMYESVKLVQTGVGTPCGLCRLPVV